jgi:hypothetical protein
MIGDAPQPGEKPSSEGNPWSFSDPDAGWWRGQSERTPVDPPTSRPRHPRRRAAPSALPPVAGGGTETLLPPTAETTRSYAGEAAKAYAAGTLDTAAELTAPPETAPAPAEPVMVERNHDRADPERYDPLKPPAGHTPKVTAQTATADTPEPDVMVLPEPSPRNRPTVPIERPPATGVARQLRGQDPLATEPLPRATGDPETDARLDRLENHPFWRNDPEASTAVRPSRATRRITPPSPRRTVAAMTSLIVLALLSAFFAWVSAEPFWLAIGHGDRGYATTTQCTSTGVTQHCVGRFASSDGRFTITKVTLLGVGPGQRVPGSVIPARMVSRDSPRAYLGDTTPLLQLRWLLGFALVLFCGYTIAGVTGARRLPTGRDRRSAVLASLAGPLLLLTGFLIAAY